ncbi:MAG: magnesium/cobalt transporter CorA [Treponema sp.]|nr:magnesium/cobalt transporter CorA [Treponema sp.]
MKSIIINEKNRGLPPGTPVYVGDRPAAAMDISVINYNSSYSEQKSVSSVEVLPLRKNDDIMWISIIGLRDIDSIKKLANLYNIHPLTVEDILNTKQQPKVETFENYRFFSFKSIRREEKRDREPVKQNPFSWLMRKKEADETEETGEFTIEQISIITMKDIVISFQEVTGDPFDEIRKRILENIGQIRKMGSHYLTYGLIDAVVDEYYLVLALLEENIEDFEERAVVASDSTFITEIQDTKKHLFQIRRTILPLRDNLLNVAHQDITSPTDKFRPFLRDLQENLNNAIDTVETYREWLTNIMDVNLSVMSYQLNKVMRTLTIITSIFIPLSFIAGIYGMNFQFMPELGKPWAYPLVLGGMGAIALTMTVIFKIRRWF